MPRLALFYSSLCFFLGLGCIGFLTLDADKIDQSFYFLPLSETRLEHALKANLSAEPERITALAEPLTERDPRHVMARVSLSGVYLQKGDVSALQTHFFPLFNISYRNSKNLINLLVTLSADDVVFDNVSGFIKSNRPRWGVAYLNALLSESPREPSEYQELYSYYPEKLSFLYAQLLNRFGAERAYAAFLDTARVIQPSSQLIIDENFAQDQFAWPFGWRLNKEVVERERGGGVSLVYLGRGTPLLMEQIVRTGLGEFQIQLSMLGEASSTKGYYQLRIKCWQGAELASLNIDDLTLATKTLTLDFETADDKCKFVQLQLLGQAGDYPVPVRSQINSITLRSNSESEL